MVYERVSAIIRAMEHPGSYERQPKPELDRKRPEQLFTYGQAKQRYLRSIVNTERLPDAIDGLVEELEGFVTTAFGGNLPTVIVESQDVFHTRAIGYDEQRVVIAVEPLPFEGDAELFNEHNLQGVLYGFHRGQHNDLRAYISPPESPLQFMGGVWTPLLSVGMEGSTIQLIETIKAEKTEELVTYIMDRLDACSEEVQEAIREIVKTINNTELTSVNRLQNISHPVAKIAQNSEISPQFVDSVMELITLRLRITEPLDIQTTAYRAVISEQPSSYKAHGAATFMGVVPQLGLIGETRNKGLGLFFINEDRPVQIPVQYITRIHNVE